ncbi:MAG: PIN domain-containing protein [Oculatellaceae cyanobacterium Prado106]|jgi:predicted nucleic acid-binding protein|nr:PIN domain-containing protein [Oculatellaceae cyanobacterium Prado106]
MEIVIADTGFIVALTNRNDNRHSDVRTIYVQNLYALLPQTVLVEVAYLLGRDVGIAIVVAFLRGISASHFTITELTDQDIARTAEILEQYADSRLDFVDATVMAVAERLGITTVLTLDQRDFRIFRPKHCESFTLLP